MAHILSDDPSRYVMLPVKHSELHKRYEQQLSCFWNTNEVDLSKDDIGFNELMKQNKSSYYKFLASSPRQMDWWLKISC